MSVCPTPRIANDAALKAVMRVAEKFGTDDDDALDVARRDQVERIGVERGDGDRRLLQVGFAAAGGRDENFLERPACLRGHGARGERAGTGEHGGNDPGDRPAGRTVKLHWKSPW